MFSLVIDSLLRRRGEVQIDCFKKLQDYFEEEREEIYSRGVIILGHRAYVP